MLIRRATLQVLAQLGRTETSIAPDARRRAYAALDPLIRGVTRRRVVRAVASALHETQLANDEAHVHRLAYLRVRGERDLAANDLEQLRGRFLAVAAPTPGALTTWLPRVLGLAALPLLGASLYFALRAPPSVDPYATAQVSSGAYASGGRPTPPTDAQRRVLREDLQGYLIALHAVGAQETTTTNEGLVDARQRILDDSVRAFGTDTSSFLHALLDQSEAIALEGNGAIDSHTRAADAFDQELGQRGIGLYLDTDVWLGTGRPRPTMSSFEVEHVSVYRSGTVRVSALLLRRLDRPQHNQGVLGYTRAAIRDALVLAEPLEGNLVTEVLPTLGDAESYPMVDPETRASGAPWVASLETTAARTLRSALGHALPSAQSVRPLARLFERRRAVFDALSARVDPSYSVYTPRSYRFDVDDLGVLADISLNSERTELARVEAGLEQASSRELWARLFSIFVASVERHEVQHRLDFLADAEAQGDVRARYEVRGSSERAGRELSAYLAQIARDGDLAPSTLTLLANHAFDRRAPRMAYRSVASMTLQGLAEELSLDVDARALGPRPSREDLAQLYVALVARPPAELSDAARRLWERLFQRTLPPLERVGE